MSTITGTLSNEKGISSFIQSHPIIAYFILAFAGTWLVISPLVMDAFEIIQLSDAVWMLFYLLASLTGPNLAAFWVTGVIEGKAGMGRLFRRMFQVRAGLHWYMVVLFVFLGVWLAAYSFLYNGVPLANLLADPSVLVSVFLPNILIGLLIPSIAEEPGWRGFALPQMQKYYGPLTATLVIGFLHGIWHLPALFTPMLGPFTMSGFIIFVLTAAAGTFIYTWIFNNTRGSVWIAMLLHSSSNAASKLVSELVPTDVELTGWMKMLESGWINVIAFWSIALVLVIVTRGRLGFRGSER